MTDHVLSFDFGPDYTVDLEFLWFGVVLHTTTKVPFTKRVLESYRRDLRLIASSLSVPVFAFQTESHDPKKRKFIQRLGFRLDHMRTTAEGEWAEMFRYLPLD
ncbi:hypothetical protein [Paracoccus sp. (in: a-proteobacteria)]|uniref:hypothetical protein n=1 Tax=Paracoccus sp. TaxID=267 RepID=UPI0026E092F9|nr:hypothetical protein [Paracoccus sp. (in: a-proteobacteria)]MDO5647376.1 hypothetical protein [Paracoccus sp. (in: a-proteobacteria)]